MIIPELVKAINVVIKFEIKIGLVFSTVLNAYSKGNLKSVKGSVNDKNIKK